MEWKTHKFDAIFSITPELDIISFQKYTLNPTTSAIFRIPHQTISPKFIFNNLGKNYRLFNFLNGGATCMEGVKRKGADAPPGGFLLDFYVYWGNIKFL